MEDRDQKRMIQELEGSDRTLGRKMGFMVSIVAIGLAMFHLYVAGFGLPGIGSRTFLVIHLILGVVLVFLIFPIRKGMNQKTIPWYDLLLAVVSFGMGVYLIRRQTAEAILSARPTEIDLIIGALFVVIVIEATRRVVGWPLVIIAGVFISYFFLGEFMPGEFYHNRGDFSRFIYEIVYRSNGIFGTPIYASAQFVFIFILFGAILESTGAGKMFIDLAIRGFGKFKGGPAKASVVASGMMGSISGSSTANAVTTGTFTIPLMKKVGFPPHVAGGVEVAASSSGQFLPPVMGAAAFIMVEFTGIPYYEIIKSAFIPALLAYVGILFMVHFEASRRNISGMDPSEMSSARKLLLRQGYMLVPILILLYYLVIERASVNASAFYTIIAMIVIALFTYRFKERLGRTILYAAILLAVTFSMQYLVGYVNQGLEGLNAAFGTRVFNTETIRWRESIFTMVLGGVVVALLFGLFQRSMKQDKVKSEYGAKELFEGFDTASRNALSIIVACATAGILIGVITTSGLSTKFTRIVIEFSDTVEGWLPNFMITDNTQVYIALVLTVFACLLLGLGLPTTATYVVLAAVIAPVLTDLGLPVIVAHLFVLYYGVLADDTPPINLPAYATAGIANAGPIRTGVQGFKYDSAALLLPFMFAINPTILLITDATALEMTWAVITAAIGMATFASFIQNYMLTNYNIIERVAAVATALLFIQSDLLTDAIAVGLFILIVLFQLYKRRKEKRMLKTV
ncbi:TRAP transporter fused permease subunit [Salinicoccus sp. ID82-1]|uniref:TRAP transporter permease n=1 Tax=Salinicoccus sp. ID82-1 TaxID=2820269 RepID=UPI001F00893B|nr:TRAP transporter fused permease subunit [Salinicoccus sp. ID82-1]MCG1010320.1 TRAP transporter fused permease subunit [Salinicoccus sp. ID82-1]